MFKIGEYVMHVRSNKPTIYGHISKFCDSYVEITIRYIGSESIATKRIHRANPLEIDPA